MIQKLIDTFFTREKDNNFAYVNIVHDYFETP